MKKNVSYVGNKQGVGKATVTTIDTLSEKLKLLGYNVATASSKKNKVLRLSDMLFMVYKARKTTEIVLIDTYSTLNFHYAVWVASLCRRYHIPYIPILHGGDLPKRLERNPKMSEKLFGNAHINVSPSYYLLDAFKAKGFQNVVHIPNTIDIKEYPFKTSNSGTCKLLWVRSFSEIYNPVLALDILELLLKERQDASLCMVGPDKDGSLQKCRDIAKEKNLPVTFTGLLTKNEWIELAADFDVFINTTNFDNMPVSVIEAMALGLPVISTNVGGLPHLIKPKEGILVPPNNASVFVKEIQELMANNSLYASLKNAARIKAESFDWAAIKKSWEAILDF